MTGYDKNRYMRSAGTVNVKIYKTDQFDGYVYWHTKPLFYIVCQSYTPKRIARGIQHGLHI